MIATSRMGSRLAAAAAALLIATLASLAQSAGDEERLARAREHVKLFVVDRMIEDIVPALSQQIAAGIRKENPSLPEDEVAQVAARIADLIGERMAADLPDMTAELMAAQFTADEIGALTGFYSSPQGRTIVGKMGSYSAAVMQTIVPYVQEIAPEITETAINQLRQEGVLK